MYTCECRERYEMTISSKILLDETKAFFEQQKSQCIYQEMPVTQPYHIGYDRVLNRERGWYADKWYRCTQCGCLWELADPDYPAKAFVRKFQDGKYKMTE